MRKWFALATMFALFSGLAAAALEESTPEAEGVPPAALVHFLGELEKRQWPDSETQSFVVLKNGKIIAEAYRAPYTAETRRGVASVTKGFTGIAVGFAVQEGRLKLDDKVVGFFPGRLPEPLPEAAKKLTVRDLLRMQTGHDKCASGAMFEAKDHVRGFFEEPFVHEPGTTFRYNSGASWMLSEIITKLTGMSMADYLKPRLFEPIGFGEFEWEADDQGVNYGGWGMVITTRQMAMFGQFCVQKGQWNGKQLLNREWFDLMTADPADTCNRAVNGADWNYGYGLHVWLTHIDGVTRFDGSGGQYVLMMPEQNAVVAAQGCVRDFVPFMTDFWNYLYPGLCGMRVPPVEDAAAGWAAEVAAFKCALPVSCGAGFPSHIAADFKPNELKITSLEVSFDGKVANLKLNAEPQVAFEVGAWRKNSFEPKRDELIGYPFYGAAAVAAPNQLKLEGRNVAFGYAFTIEITSGDSDMKITFSDNKRTVTVDGQPRSQCR